MPKKLQRREKKERRKPWSSAARVVASRELAVLTQHELIDKVQEPGSTDVLRQIETGERRLGIGEAVEIGRVTNVNPDWLLGRSDDIRAPEPAGEIAAVEQALHELVVRIDELARLPDTETARLKEAASAIPDAVRAAGSRAKGKQPKRG